MKSIFKTYDIRGIYPNEINESIFYDIGLNVKMLGITEIIVGRDDRLSSQALFDSFVSGLVCAGIDVIDIGVVTSPMLSFYCVNRKIHGAMITASHNPKNCNGLKFIDTKGVQLDYDDFLNRIEKLMSRKMHSGKFRGNITIVDILSEYTRNILSHFKYSFKNNIRCVFDCSNGTGGISLSDILPKLNVSSVIINENLDGNFPNHPSDQTKPKNLFQLQKEVLKNKADIGIMFDGDADRCAFVDETGNIVPLDIAFLVLVLNEIKKSKIKRPKILFDLRFSRCVAEVLSHNGAIPVVLRVGNPFYKKRMHKDKTNLMAGELSGHIMYEENFSIDDALYASIKMINLLSNSKIKLSKIIEKYKKYYSSGEISIHVNNPEKIISFVKSYYLLHKMTKILTIDGVSVVKEDVWFNLRASNTESLVRLVIEGTNLKEVNKEKNLLVRLIEKNDKK